MPAPHLQFDAVSKRFPGVRALDAVSFVAFPGSIHAVVGENGAGKSTLLKILSGVYRPDDGRLRLGGAPRDFRSTRDAIAAGVAVIYQELNLVPDTSVAENLYLGHLPARFGWLHRSRLRADARRQLVALGEDFDPAVRVGTLSIGQRQMVEIAKALTRDAQVIAFDEPTSSLSNREVARLFAVIRELRAQGRVILYVAHRMAEIFELCDAATVLRDGRHVETFPSLVGVTHELLVQRMVGRPLADVYHYAPRPLGPPALEIAGLAGPGLRAPATFSVARGEIVGFFGLVGAGRTELLKLIFGAVPATAGRVLVCGAPAAIRSPRAAIRAGIVLCPEDRKKEGIVPVRSVMENLNLSGRRHFSRCGVWLNGRRERANAAAQVARLAIKTPSLGQLVTNLSGGNQQKTVLGRWLSENIRVLLLDEPTRGIDVGAKGEFHMLIHELAAQGIGVVVVSSDLPEVLGICDRICVMRQGAIVASLARSEATQERVLQLALPQTGRGSASFDTAPGAQRSAGIDSFASR